MTPTDKTPTELTLGPDNPADIVRYGQLAALDALRMEMVALTTFAAGLSVPQGPLPVSPQANASGVRADDAEAIFDNMPV
jgi:hypothetical protein